MGRGVDIPWVEGVDMAWIRGLKYHRKGGRYTMSKGSIYHGYAIGTGSIYHR